jgi:hypothetical protein
VVGDPPKKKDFWDKTSVVLQPLGGLLTAGSVAVVGILGSQVLEERQSADTNARLYSELMSRREEAESALRKDMFVSIIGTFLNPASGGLDDKVLNLELLAYNFHDSLNLKPLFLDVRRRIARSQGDARVDQLTRINRVAREIAEKQLFALEGRGKSFRRTVDFEELKAAGRAGIQLEGETLEVDGKTSTVGLRVLGVNPDMEQIHLRLEVAADAGAMAGVDTRAAFEVGFFDFPMIDNTRLANGLRCAVTLNAISAAAADLTTTCFPGEYASLKDRPYYDEVIQKLQEATRTTTQQ